VWWTDCGATRGMTWLCACAVVACGAGCGPGSGKERTSDLSYRRHQRNLARARDAARGAEAKGEHRRAARIRSKAERTSAAGARARAERRRSTRAFERQVVEMREARRRWQDAAAEIDRTASGADAWALAAAELEQAGSR